jgi:putative aldouronate transport system permease protein
MGNIKFIPDRRVSYGTIILKDFKKNKYTYLMGIFGILYYIIFKYWPMYGAIIAFKNFRAGLGIWGSPWVGLEHFRTFFSSIYCLRLIRNTALLSIYDILFGFPAPIILALLLNEIRQERFKRFIQTVTYMPHFISLVVVCGLLKDFTSYNGLINSIILLFGGEKTVLLQRPEVFRPLYIISGIWQSIGWNSIIYLAALSNIDIQLYDAAKIDGANRFMQAIHITLPGIVPTIMILLILKVGSVMSIGHEKTLLLYNSATYETADVISTYVYRRGLLDGNYSFSTDVGLFNSVINFFLITFANAVSKKFTETSLW